MWTSDFAAAKAKAKAEKKLLLVDFTGSDWCVWCKKLDAEVFDKDVFRTQAPKQFVLVELDYPHAKKLPDDVQAQNKKLAKEYKILGYPTVLLLDAEGQVIAHTGYQPYGPEKYMVQLGKFSRIYQGILAMKAALEKSHGLDRAKLLDQLIAAYDKLNNPADDVLVWGKEIIALDADNKAGLKKKYEVRVLMTEADQLLKDQDAGVRRTAAGALGDIGPEATTAIAALKELLHDRQTSVRHDAADALRKIGPAAIPALTEVVRGEDCDAGVAAVSALEGMGPAAVPALTALLKDKDYGVRCAAVQGLGRIGPAAVPALTELLKDKDERVRRSAVSTLERIGREANSAVPALQELLKDNAQYVRIETVDALGAIGAVPALTEALKDKDEYVRRSAAVVLGKMGPDAVPALAEALKDGNNKVRWAAAMALGDMGPEAQTAIPALAQLLRDADALVRQTAADALENIKQGKKR